MKGTGTSHGQKAGDWQPAERMGEQIRAVCPQGAHAALGGGVGGVKGGWPRGSVIVSTDFHWAMTKTWLYFITYISALLYVYTDICIYTRVHIYTELCIHTIYIVH